MSSVYERRSTKSMTQKELARALGVSSRTVSAWETHTRVPSAPHRRALAGVLGGNPSDYDRDYAPATSDLIEEARAVLAEARANRAQTAADVGDGPYSEYLSEQVYVVLERYIAEPDHPDEAALVWVRGMATAMGRYRVLAYGHDAFEGVRMRCMALVDRILGDL